MKRRWCLRIRCADRCWHRRGLARRDWRTTRDGLTRRRAVIRIRVGQDCISIRRQLRFVAWRRKAKIARGTRRHRQVDRCKNAHTTVLRTDPVGRRQPGGRRSAALLRVDLHKVGVLRIGITVAHAGERTENPLRRVAREDALATRPRRRVRRHRFFDGRLTRCAREMLVERVGRSGQCASTENRRKGERHRVPQGVAT